ncbi:MAG: hypothetical protein ACK4TB_04635 [Gemmobacter sp.]
MILLIRRRARGVKGTREPDNNPLQEQTMDAALGILTFGTIGFVAAFAYISARQSEKRLREIRAARQAAENA